MPVTPLFEENVMATRPNFVPANNALEFTQTLPLRHDKTAPRWKKWYAGLLLAGLVAAGIWLGFYLGLLQPSAAEFTINASFQPSHAILGALLVSMLAVVVMLEQRTRRAEAIERMLHGVLESIPACSVLIVDHQERIVSANKFTVQMFGYSRHELHGKPLTLLLPQLEPASRSSLSTAEPNGGEEYLGKRKGGKEITLEIGSSMPDAQGVKTLILRDITRAKQTQQVLREREAHLRLVVEQMPAILWTTDTKLKITSTMGAGLAALDLKPQEIIGLTMLENLDNRNLESTPIAAHVKALQGQSLSYEMEWKKRAFQVRVEPLRNSKKAITGTIGIVLDITDRKQTLVELQERVRQQAAVADLGQKALAGGDPSELFQQVAALIHETLAVDCSLVATRHDDGPALYLSGGVGWKSYYPPGAKVADRVELLAAGDVTIGSSVFVHDARSEPRLRASPWLHEHDVVSGLSTVIRGQERSYGVLGVFTKSRRTFTKDDAHFLHALANILATRIEHAQAEQARSRLAAILEATTDLVAIMDKDQHLLYLNRAGREMMGVGLKDELCGRCLSGFFTDTARKQFTTDVVPTALRNGVWQGEVSWRTRAGAEIPVSQVVLAHKSAEGAVEFYSTIARDLGERRQLEDQLRQALKLEAVGRLAGGVAHDFNNLLCIITGYSDLLLTMVPPEEKSHDFIKEIKQAGERAASLTQQLLAFSRKQMLKPTVLNLNTLVTNMQRMLGRLIGEDIELTATLDPALHPIQADPGQIEQILLNLGVNARDAMPKGGKLAIATANVRLDALREHPEVKPGPYAALLLTDTGCGMPSAVMSHIFEPFFTTKDFGKGTGLGLATVYGIVKQSGGHIEVQSEVGQGTTFRIFLPGLENAHAAEAKPAAAPAVQRGTETILLVEDENGVRSMARQVLEQSGYTVLEAADGGAALTQVETHRGPIHLLLTDVVMPRVSGGRVAQLLTPQRPNMKVLYMSGYTDSDLMRNGIVTGQVDCLLKPFSPADLARTVREVLDRKPAHAAQQEKLERYSPPTLMQRMSPAEMSLFGIPNGALSLPHRETDHGTTSTGL